jgi:hypothetical protein
VKVPRNAPCPCGSGRKYKHCCLGKEPAQLPGAKVGRPQVQILDFNISGEIDYIIGRAQNGEARIVTIGPLVLFSTETGDAWMLDPKDKLALCLARGGERESFTVMETPKNYAVAWQASYRLDGEKFIVLEPSGRIRTIFSYPTKRILQALSKPASKEWRRR